MSSSPPTLGRDRIEAIDWLRGVVMILMTLDHVRGEFHDYHFNAADPEKTVTPLFITRVITHACAPTFLFLAGASIHLAMLRGRTRMQMARDSFVRGLWMILLEFTVVHLGFAGKWDFSQLHSGVFFALGGSMITMSLLLLLATPQWLVGLIGLTFIFGHNALDGWHADSWGPLKPVWQILKENTLALVPYEGAQWKFQWPFFKILEAPPVPLHKFEGARFSFRWPIIPWFGLMAAGYGFGPVLNLDRSFRRRVVAILGVAAIAGFFALRYQNVYGDTHPWKVYGEAGTFDSRTYLSFFHVEKYGPSLCYALMTLGPILCLFAWADRSPPPLRFISVFGRTPMFYYLLHLHLIQVLSWATKWVRNDWLPKQIWGDSLPTHSMNHHLYLLAWAYLGTLTCAAILYPFCILWDRLKAKHRNNWFLYYL